MSKEIEVAKQAVFWYCWDMAALRHDEHLYTKILLWTYKKQPRGFTRSELGVVFDLEGVDKGELRGWVQDVFYRGTNDNPPLITSFPAQREGQELYTLSSRGIAAAVDYIELRDARKASLTATRIAIFAILISIAVAIYQILFPTKVIVIEDQTVSGDSTEQIPTEPLINQ